MQLPDLRDRRYGNRPGNEPPDSSRAGGPLAVWYSLTSPAETERGATFDARERLRRGRLLSTIGLGFIVVMLIAVPIGLTDLPTFLAISGALVMTVLALALNRAGWVTAAGVLFVMASEAQFVFAILSAPGGKLDVVFIPLFSLLAFGLLIGVSVLPPVSVFAIAAANTLFVIADINLQPATPTVQKILNSPDRYALIAQPVGLYFITAIIAYLWVRSTTAALRRADRAEEIAELERREAERTRELEEGVRQLLDVHVHLANGDFQVRAQPIRNPLLWQIGSSLNNLIARLSRVAQADFVLRRTQEESRRLAEAVDQWLHGRQAIWPAPSQTPIDPIAETLRRGLGGGAGGQATQLPPNVPPSTAGRALASPDYSPGVSSQPAPSGDALPAWLFPSGGQGGEPARQPGPVAPFPQYPQYPQYPQSHDPSPHPWSVDPEANLPEWLRQASDDGTDRGR